MIISGFSFLAMAIPLGSIFSFKYFEAGDLQKVFFQHQIVSIIIDN